MNLFLKSACPAKPLIWSEGDRVAAAAKDTDCAGCP